MKMTESYTNWMLLGDIYIDTLYMVFKLRDRLLCVTRPTPTLCSKVKLASFYKSNDYA